jgi:hypothetical protein
MKLAKIISGGQTGVDRAALDVALELGIPCGGWCPQGRRAEDGVIPARYPVQENDSPRYPPRTAMNVREADGTLVLTRGTPDRGTALTIEIAKRQKKPALIVDLDQADGVVQIRAWLQAEQIKVLNVAGPRESSRVGIQEQAAGLLRDVLTGIGRARRR